MTYTLRQVQPLLNAAELELFHAGRAAALKELTPRQLAGKITRARNLRDKYRDLHQRQNVETQRRPARERQPMGGENQRTETKVEIFAELLERFEGQRDKLQTKTTAGKGASKSRSTASHHAPGAPADRTNPASARSAHRPRDTAAASGAATKPMRGAAGTKPRAQARKDRAALEQAEQVVAARNAAPASPEQKTKAAKKSGAAQAGADSAAKPTKPKKPRKADKPSVETGLPSAGKLVRSVRKAVKAKQQAEQENSSDLHQSDAASGQDAQLATGPRALAQGGVPSGSEARAQRVNPLKEKPINQKIHASQRGRNKVQQAKRDK